MRTPEQLALAEMVADVAAGVVDLEAVKAEKSLGVDLAPWAQAGLVDMIADGDGSVADLAVAHEELGRAAAAAPVGAASLALAAARDLGAAPSGLVLPVGAAGSSPLVATRAGRTWSVTGTVRLVPWADGLDHVLVVATDAGTPVLGLVDIEHVAVLERSTIDLTRRLVDVTFADVALQSVLEGEAAASTALALEDALVIVALADALGATERLLTLTVEHVTSREQFGQLIGSFQAVKHHAADMRSAVASSRATIDRAVTAVVDGPADRSMQVSSAAIHAFPALSTAASTALQLHGGMGFTWEHDLHLFLRRVTTHELLATPERHVDRLAARW